MRRSLGFWYYFAVAIALILGLIFSDFSTLTASVRLLMLSFLGLAIIGPAIFIFRSRQSARPVPPATGRVTISGDQAVQLALLQNVNQELEGKLQQLKIKERELTSANEHLLDIDKAKSQFVSMTTHQLRTPLAAIKWTFHMIINGELGPVTDDQKHFLQKGYESADRVITVINDWLNADYIEANRDEYKFVPVNIAEMIDSVVFEFTGRLTERNVNLIVNRPKSNLPSIAVDPIKLSMAIENLLDNALKYTPKGGQVTVDIIDDKINSAEKVLEIDVSDNGIGIPKDEQAKIFGRFFRSSNAGKIAAHGSGLGLFIVKDIIEKHGGKIWFDSEEGKGTKFHLTIPIKQK